jgi:endonuclease III
VEQRTVRTRLPVDLGLTLGPLAGPCVRVGADGVWRATRTPAGPATAHYRSTGPCCVEVRAWGPGAATVTEDAPALVGAEDDDGALAPAHPVVMWAARRFSALRIGRTGAVMEAVVPTVLAQKVNGVEARAAWASMVRAYRQTAPGPSGLTLLLPPDADWLQRMPSWAFHRWGVEHKRAATIKTASSYAHRLEGQGQAETKRRLAALPGVGPWTVNEVAMVALGDADAVSVGDYWLAHQISWALAGEPRGTDERMLELLEPWRGQRGRVCRLVALGSPLPPRFGPRLPLRRIAAD